MNIKKVIPAMFCAAVLNAGIIVDFNDTSFKTDYYNTHEGLYNITDAVKYEDYTAPINVSVNYEDFANTLNSMSFSDRSSIGLHNVIDPSIPEPNATVLIVGALLFAFALIKMLGNANTEE
jgi:hypothetical protein